MNTSKSLDEPLIDLYEAGLLHGEAQANGVLPTQSHREQSVVLAKQAIVEAVEGLVPKVSDLDSPLQQSWKLGGTDEESFRRGYLQAVTSTRQAIKEWQ